MAIIHASIQKNHYATTLKNVSGTILLADEPISDGGEDLGFSPSELLASALATCTCMTLRMYADRKAWPLDDALVDVVFTRNIELNSSSIIRTITLVGELLTSEQRERLLQIANSCYIHKALSNPIHIITELT